ncbi:hypothetical protein M9458_052942 [Cirrhinus mrigala]|uniref:Uncharacterized protein n=1 Tax=Cirrhinus mrigala TaxID=683832 RepID=A0ABD0MT91_CIRMR
MNQQQTLHQRQHNSTLNTTVSRNQDGTEGKICLSTHNPTALALSEKYLLEGRLLFKIAVDTHRGLSQHSSVYEKGETAVCAADPTTKEVNVAASHAETLHSAPKNRTSEQMHMLPYLYPDGRGVASCANLHTQFHWPVSILSEVFGLPRATPSVVHYSTQLGVYDR